MEEALNKGIGSFQELLQQQKDELKRLQQDYSSYTELACLHPSVVMAHRASSDGSSQMQERTSRSTKSIMRQVPGRACVQCPASCFTSLTRARVA